MITIDLENSLPPSIKNLKKGVRGYIKWVDQTYFWNCYYFFIWNDFLKANWKGSLTSNNDPNGFR